MSAQRVIVGAMPKDNTPVPRASCLSLNLHVDGFSRTACVDEKFIFLSDYAIKMALRLLHSCVSV